MSEKEAKKRGFPGGAVVKNPPAIKKSHVPQCSLQLYLQ